MHTTRWALGSGPHLQGLWADETGERGGAAPRLVAKRPVFGRWSAEEGAGVWIRAPVLGCGLGKPCVACWGPACGASSGCSRAPLQPVIPGPLQGVGLGGPPAGLVPRVRLLLRLHPPGAAGGLKPLPQGATCCGRRAATPTHSRPGRRAPVSLGDFESICGNSSAPSMASLSEGALFPPSSLIGWISDF